MISSDLLAVSFWCLLIVGIYPYAIYPIVVGVLGRVSRRRVAASDGFQPTVTVVIAAFNEAKHIEATVRTKLSEDYPRDLLREIVVSDGSEDGTDDIVERIASDDSRVSLIRQTPRQGKTAGLNLALREATGEIVVFSDANSIYRRDAIAQLARNFADPEVGYVTGRMLYVNESGSLAGDGCTAYMRYENWLRAAETRLGSIVGADGGVDAVRRALYVPMRPDQLPDFVLPLNVREQGKRVIYEPAAVLTEEALSESGAEFRMRVRVALRAFWALKDKAALLNPLRFGVFSWQLFSHKLLRYGSFVPLALAAAINWILLDRGVLYIAAAAGQVAVGLIVLITWLVPAAAARSQIARLCSYFVLLNVASGLAAIRFLRGQKQVLWKPRTG
jgi:cellulose synthase/poly-beta-1,6-N-acetylglucosamine synthase-like glycosyltransferase